jgi:TRAP-type C4-dicarboxylate transport system permease large subunit
MLLAIGYFVVLMLVPRLRAALLARATFALLMPVIILGGIYGGVFTPTEASVVAVFYALLIGIFVYREVRPRDVLAVSTTATGASLVPWRVIVRVDQLVPGAELVTR